MGLFADRAGTRMGARQQYRTMARMQRRRSYFQSKSGSHQDFQSRDDEGDGQPEEQAQAAPDYTSELKELAQLKNDGVLTEDEYAAKKKQLLGI